MIEFITGALVVVVAYLAVESRRERRIRDKEDRRLEKWFLNHVESQRTKHAQQAKGHSSELRNIHARINGLLRERENDD